MVELSQVLLQTLAGSPTRSFRSVEGGAIYFGTDVGLRRDENQDRVAVARWGAKTRRGFDLMTAVVVSDGMGGMQEGAFCASQTVATFLASLMRNSSPDLRKGIGDAVHAANDTVYSLFRGKGGATLSAVVVSGEDVIGVNVGDSRIYSPARSRADLAVRRLTTDDTMKEAFGSEGDGLLQYIGVGPGIQPHFIEVSPADLVVITTDGAHFVDQRIFHEILARSPDPKAIVERTVALSRWLGAPDNSTVAAVDIQRLMPLAEAGQRDVAELWSGSTDGPLYVLQSNVNAEREFRDTEAHVTQSKREHQASDTSTSGDAFTPTKPATKAKRRKKTETRRSAPEQLTIDVEVTEDGAADADR